MNTPEANPTLAAPAGEPTTTDPSLATGTDTPAAPPPEAAGDLAEALAQPAEAPATTPTVDTSDLDAVAMYEPSLKKGIHRLHCVIGDFAPSVNRESLEYQGWAVTLILAQDAPDEAGGKLDTGTRLSRMTFFTTPSQYRTPEEVKAQVKSALLALNGIALNRRNHASCQAAEAAWRALQPAQKLPTPTDTDAAHFEQWKGSHVTAVIQVKEKDGETRMNLLGFDAYVAQGA